MTLPSGVTSFYSFSIYSAQASQLYVGTNATIKGLIYAPDAEVHVYSNTTVTGSVFGKRVIIEPDVKICKPPTLLELSHSEGAMAPPFDPMVFSYKAIVPDVTSIISIKPEMKSGQTVTINGKDPSYPVDLTGTETDITVLLTHPEACGNTAYKLKVTRSANYQIFVDPNSSCTPGTEDGLTWQTAFKKLEDAIDVSVKTGQEIHLREGVYKPIERTDPLDPRSATFLIPCGTDIKGGFLGTETDGVPLGSAFNTILSGDVNGDDTNCTTWPPSSSELQYVDDNVYHVVTDNGNHSCSDSRISNLVISQAYANGTGINSSGAGILVESGNISLEFVGIVRNYSVSNGAGICVTESGGLNSLKHCLIQDNYSKNGSGAGLFYESKRSLLIDGSIFDNNTTESTLSDYGGSAIYFKATDIEMVNCVIGQNKSQSVNGAILNNAGKLKVTNCTFAFNVSTGAVSITNINSAVSDVLNSILWNSSAMDEVSDSGFNITYTCITGGHTGTANFSNDPKFINPSKPSGTDGKWGNLDDGVRLQETSPCLNKGIFTGAPTIDILEIERPFSYYGCDLGAYTYFLSNKNEMLGRLIKGIFIPITNFPVFIDITNEDDINDALLQGKTRVLQIVVPKNKYTDKKNIITAEVVGLNSSSKPIGTVISIPLYRVAGTQYFRSITFEGGRRGKHLIFLSDPGMIGEYRYAYALLGAQSGKVRVTVRYDQFK